MKKNSNPEQFKQVLALFTQLGPIVAAVGVLLGLLFGDLPDIRYKQTLSALTILVIALLIWLWRWNRITQTRRAASKKAGTPLPGFLGPFVDAPGKTYVYSLTRRRMEGLFLLLVTLGALFFIVQKGSQIGTEISGVQCTYAATRPAPLLVIFEFNDFTDQKNAFVNRLYSEMGQHFEAQISVCLSRQVVANRTEAVEFGQRLNRLQSTTIVVWGDRDDNAYEIHITPIDWSALELLLTADAADAKEMDGWARDYLPQIVWGMEQFIEGDQQQAIRTFDEAVQLLELEPWAADNQPAFAQLYSLLAQLYTETQQTTAAIAAYDQVLKNDAGLDDARLSRGILYKTIDPAMALVDFTTLIDQGADNAVYAYINRAPLQTDWELQKSDFLAAIALEPDEPSYYHSLGASALAAQDFEAAVDAYREANKIMDEETRQIVIADLQSMAEKDISLQEIVGQIVTLLQQPAQ